MSEELHLPINGSKAEIYAEILPQIAALVQAESDLIANLANVAAVLKAAFDFHWVGFYITREPNLLVLGPFQGPLACTRIPFARGVCGAAATQQKTVLVADVDAFPGHIACSSLSKSEIVVPLVAQGQTWLLLDIDSDKLADFDGIDQQYLEKVIALLAARHFNGLAIE